MNSSYLFKVHFKPEDSHFTSIASMTSSKYRCKIINNILQVSMTQRFVNNTNKLANEATYYYPVNQNLCLESFQATIDGKTVKGYVKKINEAKNDYEEGIKKGDLVSYCEKKTFEKGQGECLQIKLGNIPEGGAVDIHLVYSQQIQTLFNTFYYIDLGMLMKTSNLEDNDSHAFVLELFCSSKITYFKSLGISTEETQTDQNTISFKSQQIHPNQMTMIVEEDESKIQHFKLIYSFEDIHSPQIIYGACQSYASMSKEDHANKQIELQNHSYLLSFIPDFNNKFKSQITDAIQQEIGEGKDILSSGFEKNLNETVIDQTETSQSEFIFLLDRSGSMSGGKIENAIKALILFIKSLPPKSYFNVYSFGSGYQALFQQSLAYTEQSAEEAISQFAEFSANMGGTEIYSPLSHVYSQPTIQGYGRQIYILTDGEVSNKESVIELIQKNQISNRVHTIGIGKDADKSLIIESAKSGRGCYEIVEKQEDIQESVIRILQNSISPILDSVKVSYNHNIFSSQYPLDASLNCIFKNDLFTLALFVKAGLDVNDISIEDRTINISYFDTSLNSQVSKYVVLEPQDAHKFDPSLQRSAYKLCMHLLLNQMSNYYGDLKSSQSYSEEKVNEITNLSLEHQILTKFTSYFCEIEQISDEKRVQFFVESKPEQPLKTPVFYCQARSPIGSINLKSSYSSRKNSRSRSRSPSEDRKRRIRRANYVQSSPKQKLGNETIEESLYEQPQKEGMSYLKKKSWHSGSQKSISAQFTNMQQSYYQNYQQASSMNDCYGQQYSDPNLNCINGRSAIFNAEANFIIEREKKTLNPQKEMTALKGIQNFQEILDSVNIEGVWRFKQTDAIQAAGCSKQQLEEVLKLFPNQDLFMTLLMLYILENKYSESKQKWTLISRKSLKYVERECKDRQLIDQFKESIKKLCSNI